MIRLNLFQPTTATKGRNHWQRFRRLLHCYAAQKYQFRLFWSTLFSRYHDIKQI